MQSQCFSQKSTVSKVKSAHILIVETDEKIAHLLKQELCCEGHQVNLCRDGTLGLITLRETIPDLVILGSSLPGLSCLEICRRLRTTHSDIPIIALVSEEVQDRVAALDAGADDCISYSFALEELLARIQVNLRRLQKPQPHLLNVSNLILDRQARQVYVNGREIELTTTEFNLLEYLMAHAGQVITREQVLDQVWGFEFIGTSNIIEVYIGYLRRKLEAHCSRRLIHTIRGVGYVLRNESALATWN